MWKQKSLFAMKLYLQGAKGAKKLIAIDLGTQFTGLAVSSEDLQHSFLHSTIKAPIQNQKTIRRIADQIKKQRNLKGVILGQNPISGKMQRQISQFVQKIGAFDLQVPYTFVDESYTTQQAKTVLMGLQQAYRKYGHLHKQKDLQDGLAAINILNRFLHYYKK